MGIFKKAEDNQEPTEIDGFVATVREARMPAQVEKIALKELEKLERTSPSFPEYTIGTNHIEYLVSLPWNKMTEDNLDIRHAESILDEAHYGLTEIKDRILEHLAVRILKLSRKQHILVVDDEEMTRKNLDHVLTREGYEVMTAASGSEALNLLKKHSVEVIITDLKMENVDGMGVLASAKEKDPSTEVIMISGYATVSTAVEAIKKGSYYYLSKPFKLDEIRSTVKAALSKKRAQLESRGPLLCFVGPPGTGKTSLGMSIARSLERKFIRISLAGMKDEAQIRGHRRSYVGALPGRIIQEIRRCEAKNPVFMLDEIDKIGQEFKGDPASALLEVLDPEQNNQFMDHYLDVPFDLSKTMFIATANTVGPIPEPLLDRFEVLYLSGYTEMEKTQIAFNHLIPKETSAAGLTDPPVRFTPEAVRKIIREYTREAGLRDLQRQFASLCRKIARDKIDPKIAIENLLVTEQHVETLLGPCRFFVEVTHAKDRIGVATALAWTDTGGEIVFIEATKMKGRNQLILTGSLGTVMKESAQAALSYIRSHIDDYRIPEDFFERHDIHIHIPAGAIPKDGPSAGLPIAMALLSLITGRPCRRDVALTGELTLTGRILPVGGVKEKVLAAHRAGVKTVVFPAKNRANLRDIPAEIQNELAILSVEELPQAIDLVFK